MNGFVGFEQLPVFCRRFGIGREFAVDLEAVPDCGTAVLVDSDAGSREKRRAERGVAGRGNRERKIEDVADDFAPDPAAPAASDEEQALHEKPDENSGVRWFALRDVIPNTREPEMRVVYQKLMDKCAGLP